MRKVIQTAFLHEKGHVHNVAGRYRSVSTFISDKASVHTTPKLPGMKRSDYWEENYFALEVGEKSLQSDLCVV